MYRASAKNKYKKEIGATYWAKLLLQKVVLVFHFRPNQNYFSQRAFGIKQTFGHGNIDGRSDFNVLAIAFY